MSNQQYDNTNRGALFPAKQKRNPNSPDYTGEININGVDYFLSGWGKESRNGQKFVSLAVSPKNRQQSNTNLDPFMNPGQSQPTHQRPPAQMGMGPAAQAAFNSKPPQDYDDDIPF